MSVLVRGAHGSGETEVDGLVDTGADQTCFEDDVLVKLGYTPVGFIDIEGATSTDKCALYYVTFDLPEHNPPYRVELRVVGLPSVERRGLSLGLIGRDLISLGTLQCDGPDDRCTFAISRPTDNAKAVRAMYAQMAALGGPPQVSLGSMPLPSLWDAARRGR